MFVKVCGITNRADAWAAIDAGAQALGFVLHPASPRYISLEFLREWIDEMPREIWRVGVFVDRPGAEIERICAELRLDVAQLHGNEPPDAMPRGLRVWKAFRLGNELPSREMDYPVEAVMLDGAASGRSFDWRIARGLDQRVVLAGGLNEENVAEAIGVAQPWGVDACSSLEVAPGRKDRARMARFIEACQQQVASR